MKTMTEAECEQWIESRPRYRHRRESFEAARKKVGSPNDYRVAQVKVYWTKQPLLEVLVPVRHTEENLKNVESITHYPWPVLFRDRVRATGVDWEVLKPFGNMGFLTRLVLRGFPPQRQVPFIDIASVEFRIPYEHPRLFLEDADESAWDHVEHTGRIWFRNHAGFSDSAKPMTPMRLSALIAWMTRCQIKTIGMTQVRSLFNRGTVHRLGEAFQSDEGGFRQTA